MLVTPSLVMMAKNMANIDETHPGNREIFKNGAFSVATSTIPGYHTNEDKTMEGHFMKHSISDIGASRSGSCKTWYNYGAC